MIIIIGVSFFALLVSCIRFMFHFSEDGAERKIEDLANFTLVHPTGTNFRSTELAPGAKTVMVGVIFIRTASLLFN